LALLTARLLFGVHLTTCLES